MTSELLKKTASDLGRLIETGDISPTELTNEFLKAMDDNPLINRIYAHKTNTRALAEAQAATNRATQGTRIGPLDGVPISWKDLFNSASSHTEAGSAFLKGNIPDNDAEVLTNATLGGLVCLGKTHMSELAFSGLGLNPITETPPCVNDLAAVSGGSSSGAAASVAFNLAAAGIGSDTGGSVRIPAAWNDLVGLKTTSGLVSLNGVVPLCTKFDTVGPLSRSVEDTSNLFDVLLGSAHTPLNPSNLKNRRFAICTTLAMDDIRDQPKAAFENAISDLKNAGATIEDIAIPPVASAMPLAGCLYTTEAYAQWQHQIDTRPELMYSEILDRFIAGRKYLGYEYVQAWQELEKLRAHYYEITAGYDAVLMPTSPILPPNINRLLSDSDFYIQENLLALRNTRIGNLLGLCALTLPTTTPSCGLMICCNPFKERQLLNLGAEIERTLS